MAKDARDRHPIESSPLLGTPPYGQSDALAGQHGGGGYEGDVESLLSSAVSKDERALLTATQVGERLPYNDYTTIDWLHDLVKDSVRHRRIHSTPGLRGRFLSWWDSAQGWVAACLIGLLTAGVAFVVDVSVATVADWKEGYCSRDVWLDKASCCASTSSLGSVGASLSCTDWKPWVAGYPGQYAVYVAFALLFGIVAGTVTLTTRTNLPSISPVENGSPYEGAQGQFTETATGKMMYMAAGSGIPEIKTILSGFVIPHFLDLKVLLVKAVGATFAVSTGMCLGKEGPFVHISTCVGYLVAMRFDKYRNNQRKMREMLSVACSAGLSVAFGAPIGGVLFSYEVNSCLEPWLPCCMLARTDTVAGNKHLLSAPCTLALIFMLARRGCYLEGAQSNGDRQARPL